MYSEHFEEESLGLVVGFVFGSDVALGVLVVFAASVVVSFVVAFVVAPLLSPLLSPFLSPLLLPLLPPLLLPLLSPLLLHLLLALLHLKAADFDLDLQMIYRLQV